MKNIIYILLFLFVFILLLLYACSREKEIKAINVISGQSGRSYDVYYYDNLTMYQYKYIFDSLVDGSVVLHEERPMNFVFNNDSAFGYLYYPFKNPALKEGRYKVDSLLEVQRFNNPLSKTKTIDEENQKQVMKYFEMYKKLKL